MYISNGNVNVDVFLCVQTKKASKKVTMADKTPVIIRNTQASSDDEISFKTPLTSM